MAARILAFPPRSGLRDPAKNLGVQVHHHAGGILGGKILFRISKMGLNSKGQLIEQISPFTFLKSLEQS